MEKKNVWDIDPITGRLVREAISPINKETRGICFYDGQDYDGCGSRAVVENTTNVGKEITFIGLNRDMKTKDGVSYLKLIEDYVHVDSYFLRHVMFLDLAPREKVDMAYVSDVIDVVIVIDHHEYSYDMSEFKNIDLFHSDSKSACMLTWEYFHQDKKAPYVVELINDRDMWINKMQPKTNHFTNCFKMMNTVELGNLITADGDNKDLKKWLAIGEIREASKGQEIIDIAKNNIKHISLGGLTVAIPTVKLTHDYVSGVGSLACEDETVDFFMSVYATDSISFRYGLRSKGGQALKFIRDNSLNGGGHPNSCGFRSDIDVLDIDFVHP